MILNKKSKTYIIAEAGVNHNGSFTLAKITRFKYLSSKIFNGRFVFGK